MSPDEMLVRAFITPARRDRYIAALSSPKRRHRFLVDRLPLMVDLDHRYARRIDVETPLLPFEHPVAAHNNAIYEHLCQLGASARC